MQANCHNIEEMNAKLEDKRYEVIKLLGEGAMACVYLARERRDRHLYALKVLHDKFRHSDKHRMIFLNEAETMQRFQHPNIVRFYKYIEEETFAYIRMDYIEGITLYSILHKAKQEKLPLHLDDVMRILRQVAQGLNYLHHEEQLHLDVKPANVLLQARDGKVFLTDLGLTMDSGGVRTYVAGTPYYMPYEQQLGNSSVSTTADSYALAIMAYEMLALRRPFELETQDDAGRQAIKEAHRQSPIPAITDFRADLPPSLNAVFEKALAKNPTQRYEVFAFIEAFHAAITPKLSETLRDLDEVKAAPIYIPQKPEEYMEQLASPKAKGNGQGMIAILLLCILVIAIASLLFLQNPAPNTIAQASTATISPESKTEESTNSLPSTQPPPTQPLNQETAEEPSSESATLAATITNTSPPSSTPTITPSPTTTATARATDTPTLIPTAFLSNEPVLYLAEGFETIGIGTNLEETLAIFQAENQSLIPLRSPIINGFSLILEIANPEVYEEYGLVYRYQSNQAYWLFRILSRNQSWQIVEVAAGEAIIRETGELATLPERLAIAGRDEFFRYEMDTQFLQFQAAGIPAGSLALWLKNASASPEIRLIRFGLLGEEALAAIENPPSLAPISDPFTAYLLSDLTALYETSSLDGYVNCLDFISHYDALERHTNRNSVAAAATQARSISNFIYNRCKTSGRDSIDMSDAYVDLLNWQTDLQAIMDTLIVEN